MVVMQMNVTKRSILIAFVLSVVCGLLYLYTNTFFKTKIVAPEGLPTFIAYDSTINTYGKSGKVEKSLTSTKLSYYNEKNMYYFEKPLITSYTYNEKGIDMWHLKGQIGSMLLNEYAIISEDVELTPGFDNAPVQKATALNLKYDFHTNKITSPTTVSIFGQGFTTEGTDFSYDLNNNVLEYKGKPNAIYYPKNK